MSELKAFRIIQGDTGGFGAPSYKCDTNGNRLEEWDDICEVYHKPEADKVIVGRDKEIARLRDSIDKLLKANTEQIINEVMRKTLIYGAGFVSVEHAMRLVVEIHHHKYKRCLAMAMWCKSKSEIYNEFAADASDYMPSYEARFHKKAVLYQKWAMRWLELAKQFKEERK